MLHLALNKIEKTNLYFKKFLHLPSYCFTTETHKKVA